MKENQPGEDTHIESRASVETGLPRPAGEWVIGNLENGSNSEPDPQKYGTYNEHGGYITYVSNIGNGEGGAKFYAPADAAHRKAVIDAGYKKNESVGIPFQNTPMEGQMRQDFLRAFGTEWRNAVQQEEQQAHIDAVRNEERKAEIAKIRKEETKAEIDAIRKDLGI